MWGGDIYIYIILMILANCYTFRSKCEPLIPEADNSYLPNHNIERMRIYIISSDAVVKISINGLPLFSLYQSHLKMPHLLGFDPTSYLSLWFVALVPSERIRGLRRSVFCSFITSHTAINDWYNWKQGETKDIYISKEIQKIIGARKGLLECRKKCQNWLRRLKNAKGWN